MVWKKKKPEGVITFIGKDLSLAETWLIFFWREHSAQSIFLLRKVREHRSKESHFSRFNIYALVWYLFVSFWLTSLHMTHSRSIQLVQFSSSVVSDSDPTNRTQHARSPCPSPTPRVHPNPCLLSQWCHPTISSSVVPFSSHLQSFPASGTFLVSQFFASDSQSIGVSASALILPMNYIFTG